MARKNIKTSEIIRSFHELLKTRDMVIVEGAGGVLVPINNKRTMLDLMTALRLPVILVSRPGLGTINHTLLSLLALKQAGLDVLGVVLNETSVSRCGYIKNDNIRTIERMGSVNILGKLPFMAGINGLGRRISFAKRSSRALPAFADWIRNVK